MIQPINKKSQFFVWFGYDFKSLKLMLSLNPKQTEYKRLFFSEPFPQTLSQPSPFLSPLLSLSMASYFGAVGDGKTLNTLRFQLLFSPSPTPHGACLLDWCGTVCRHIHHKRVRTLWAPTMTDWPSTFLTPWFPHSPLLFFYYIPIIISYSVDFSTLKLLKREINIVHSCIFD